MTQTQTIVIEDKRQRILNAAQDIFFEKGLKNSTMIEIAGKAGVADSVIYYYFKNKEDLLFSALDDQLQFALVDISYQLKGIIGPAAKLSKLIWYHLYTNDINQREAKIRKHLLLACRANKKFYKHQSYQTLRKYVSLLVGILKEGVLSGNFRADINIAVIRDMIFGLLDEENISCIAAREITETCPDFDHIMPLIMSMIESRSENGIAEKKKDKGLAVLKAATTLFAEKGFSKSTMMEVGKKAEVAEGTIYEYYANKNELLLYIATDKFKAFRADLEHSYHIADPQIRLKMLIWDYFFLFTSEPDFLAIFLNDVKLNRHFYSTDSYKNFISFYSKVVENIEEGKRAGFFRKDVDSRIYRNLFIGTFSHLMFRWFFIRSLHPLMVLKELHHAADLLCRAVMLR